MKKIKIFATLGPSSMNEEVITKLDSLGIDMFRINLSHIEIEKLEDTILLIKKYTDKPICLDTEGAQIRVGYVENGRIRLEDNSNIEITGEKIVGNTKRLSFTTPGAIGNIRQGDLISIDFDSVLLQVVRCGRDPITAKVVSGGYVGSNKAVSLDRNADLPVMTEKDKMAVRIGSRHGIRHYALSFTKNRYSVECFRKFAGRRLHVISKIESKKGVENIDGILSVSDGILIDRGDLSREEPIEKIPFIQKLIIRKANIRKVPVYVATNLLESMVKSKTPTRAEVNDIVNTLLDGSDGLVLAAETAIGAYPVNCAAMVSKTINQFSRFSCRTSLDTLQKHESFLLVEPHGGTLVNRVIESPGADLIKRLKVLRVSKTVLLNAEQIAVGTFSPLEGFMRKKELEHVLNEMSLPSGVIWPLPIVLQVDKKDAVRFSKGDDIALASEDSGEIYAIMHLEDIFTYDLEKMSLKAFGTGDPRHPGVNMLKKGGKYFLGGKIDLIKRMDSEYKHYEFTPRQARAIFEHKGWCRVAGFHTRNVVHRVHEHIQNLALEKYHCDGMFIHPVVGPKKKGDYTEGVILKCYDLMITKYYPPGKVVLGAFQNYSRYAGPREAVFTALCRKNFGCSHFIVGRDHTGVADFYKPYDVHELFDRLGDIGIIPIFFRQMNYCKLCDDYVERCVHDGEHVLSISGSRAREILQSRKHPPEWFMRRDISSLVLKDIDDGKKVFV